jgi:Uma2 family endonuclease
VNALREKVILLEKRVTLNGLTWQAYTQILNVLPQRRSPRLIYDRGTLEITMPLESHEFASEMLGVFIRILVEELGLPLKSMGSTTLNRQDLDRGAEPDSAYYIQNQSQVSGRIVDLGIDPPPDLVVEVDISHTDIDKNRLYAALGIPEFWRYNGQQWRIFILQDGVYLESSTSEIFPIVSKKDLYQFLEQAQKEEVKATKALRNSVKARLVDS